MTPERLDPDELAHHLRQSEAAVQRLLDEVRRGARFIRLDLFQCAEGVLDSALQYLRDHPTGDSERLIELLQRPDPVLPGSTDPTPCLEDLLSELEHPPDASILGHAQQQISDLVSQALQTLLQTDAALLAPRFPTDAGIVDLGIVNNSLHELLVALHLYRHGYEAQVYPHVRLVFEAIDLLRLFDAQPALRKQWQNAAPSEVKARFGSGEIRRILGENSVASIGFNFLTECGVHPRFAWIQPRTVVRSSPREFSLVLGSFREPEHAPMLGICLVFAAVTLALEYLYLTAEVLDSAKIEEAKSTAHDLQELTRHPVLERMLYQPAAHLLDEHSARMRTRLKELLDLDGGPAAP